MENDNAKKVETKDYVLIQELLINREKIYKHQLAGIQNSIINFCQNMNMFQSKENFFNLTLKEQFEFNECIEFTSRKIKNDFKSMENFYLQCKTNCLEIHKVQAEDIEEKLKYYNESTLGIVRPNLHPCVNECVGMYHYMTQKYYNYMIRDLGLYSELIDYKNFVDK